MTKITSNEGLRQGEQRSAAVASGGTLADRGHRSCRITTLHSQLNSVHGSTTRAERTRPGVRGANHQFGSRLEDTGSPQNRSAVSVQLSVEP